MTDPVAHIRESLHGWITSTDEATIRAILKIRRHLDTNLKKPSIPANWKPLRTVAADLHLNPGHLARLCREIYSAQDQAKICTHRGRQTWCLSPESCATLAPRDTHRLPGPDSEPAAPSTRHADGDVDPPGGTIEGGSK